MIFYYINEKRHFTPRKQQNVQSERFGIKYSLWKVLTKVTKLHKTSAIFDIITNN